MAYIFDLVDTWASGGGPYTSIKMNATDNDVGSASLLMDLQVGGASKFKVSKSGTITAIAGSATAGSQGITFDGNTLAGIYAGSSQLYLTGNAINVASQLMVTSNVNIANDAAAFRLGASFDAIISRRGIANLRFGAADAAAPVAQTLSVQSVVAGTSNTAGANLTITGSQGTGTGAGGSIIFQVAPAGGTGIAQNGLVPALTINGSSRNVNVTTALTFTDTNYGTPPGIPAGFCGGNDSFDTFWQGNNLVLMGLRYDTGLTIGSGLYFGFSNTTGRLINSSGATDVRLYRDAANTLALRNGTAAQTFNLYGTYTDGSNYERLRFSFPASGPATIISESAGTGLARPLTLTATGSAYIQFNTAATDRWFINSSGHFLANTDNLYDIGASGATRPRSVYTGSSVYFGGDVFCANGIFFGGASYTKGYIYSNSDGVWSLNNSTSTSFGRLQFGGTTSSFPAIKRSSTTLQARLADDSAFASVQGKLTTDTNYTAGTFIATGYLTLYDAAGTAYRVPCAV